MTSQCLESEGDLLSPIFALLGTLTIKCPLLYVTTRTPASSMSFSLCLGDIAKSPGPESAWWASWG